MIGRKVSSHGVASRVRRVGPVTRGLGVLAFGLAAVLPLGCGSGLQSGSLAPSQTGLTAPSSQSDLGAVTRAGTISPAAKKGPGGGSNKTDLYTGDIKTWFDEVWNIINKPEYATADGIDGMVMKLTKAKDQLTAGNVQPSYQLLKACRDQSVELALSTADKTIVQADLDKLLAALKALMPGGEE